MKIYYNKLTLRSSVQLHVVKVFGNVTSLVCHQKMTSSMNVEMRNQQKLNPVKQYNVQVSCTKLYYNSLFYQKLHLKNDQKFPNLR